MNKQILFGIFFIILIIFLTHKKNNEHLDYNETIVNISKLYTDISGIAYFNDISSNSILI